MPRLALAAGLIVGIHSGAANPQQMLVRPMAAAMCIQDSSLREALTSGGMTAITPLVDPNSTPIRSAINRTGERVDLFVPDDFYLIETADDSSVAMLRQRLVGEPAVFSIEPVSRPMICALPVDEYYARQWALTTPPPIGINVAPVWLGGTIGSVPIGILDSGVDMNHPDLSGKTSGDGYQSTGDFDGDAHGTAVAGIAAARGGSDGSTVGGKLVGVSYGSPIISRNVITAPGLNVNVMYHKIMDIINAGAPVVNSSWTYNDPATLAPLNSPVLAGAYKNLYMMNIVSVAAMGNTGTGVAEFPAAYPGVIAVGAARNTGIPWSGSSQGAHISLLAPGVAINVDRPGGGYGSGDGTSFAAPHVTGAAALMLSIRPDLYNDDVKELLKRSAHDVVDSAYSVPVGPDKSSGWGNLDIGAAVALLNEPNRLYHFPVLTGADSKTAVCTGWYCLAQFIAVPGLDDGLYFADRYVLRKHVTFPVPFAAVPQVWGRGVASNGYMLTTYDPTNGSSPVYGVGYCDAVPGTITKTGCDLETFIYNVSGKGWFPFEAPSAAVFGYSVLGVPVPFRIDVSAQSSAAPGQNVQCLASTTAGYGPTVFTWRSREVTPGGYGVWSNMPDVGAAAQVGVGLNDVQIEGTASCPTDTVCDTLCVCSTATSLGPVAIIAGPEEVPPGAQGTWTAVVTGGRSCGVYQYEWQVKPSGDGPYGPVVGRAPNFTWTMPESTSMDICLNVYSDLRGNAGKRVLRRIPPARVTDLHGLAMSTHELWMAWTESGAEGTIGQAAQYDVRMAVTEPLDNDYAFERAPWRATGSPAAPGTQEHVYIGQLQMDTRYYFAVKVRDAEGNWSPLSNSAWTRTLPNGSIEMPIGPGDDNGLIKGGTQTETANRAGNVATTIQNGVNSAGVGQKRYWCKRTAGTDAMELLLGEAAVAQDSVGDGVAVDELTETPGHGDTTRVITDSGRLALGPLASFTTVWFGRTWHPTGLGRLVASAEDSTMLWAIVRVERHGVAGTTSVDSVGWGSAPSACGAGDTLIVTYAKVPAVGARDEHGVWIMLAGDSTVQAISASAKAAPISDEAPPRIAFGLKVLSNGSSGAGTRFAVSVPVATMARLEVFDIAGRRVRVVIDGVLSPGMQEVGWDGRAESGVHVHAGVYLCRFSAGRQVATAKVLCGAGE